LIEKDTITSAAGFLKLQHKLRSLLRCPELLLGLTDSPGSVNKLFMYGQKIGNSFLLSCRNVDVKSMEGSLYDFCFKTKRAVIIENLENYPNKTTIEEKILKQGVKNLLIAPLVYDNEIVGILEMGSPHKEIEELELEELQGIKGLRAIRVSVNIENLNFEKLDDETLFKEVEKMSVK